jgi:cbb3-type cytochrome oxidase subunit 3
MLQMVLQDGHYGFFTQAALVLFFGAFLLILLVTFTRPRRQTDRYAHMPLADDRDPEPMTPMQTNARQGGEHV